MNEHALFNFCVLVSAWHWVDCCFFPAVCYIDGQQTLQSTHSRPRLMSMTCSKSPKSPGARGDHCRTILAGWSRDLSLNFQRPTNTSLPTVRALKLSVRCRSKGSLNCNRKQICTRITEFAVTILIPSKPILSISSKFQSQRWSSSRVS